MIARARKGDSGALESPNDNFSFNHIIMSGFPFAVYSYGHCGHNAMQDINSFTEIIPALCMLLFV